VTPILLPDELSEEELSEIAEEQREIMTTDEGPYWTDEDFLAAIMDRMEKDAEYGYLDVVMVLRAIGETSDLFHRQLLWAKLRELMVEPTEPCPVCKVEQEVKAFRSGGGYAGGRIYWTELACGHVTDWDESGDMRAAY
jgi:hypothetical protein